MEDTGIRYVVGVDGSPESREALRWTTRIARALGGEIVAVHASGLLERLGGELVSADSHRADITEVVRREWCASLHEGLTPFRVIVRDGSPVDALPEVAVEEKAALLVVGSRGVGSAPALALGSTSLHLLQNARVPVLIVPSADENRGHLGLRRLLVAVDGATGPDTAADVVAWLAGGFGSRVELVHAVEDIPVFPLGPASRISMEGESDAPTAARSLIEPVRRRFEDEGLSSHLQVRRGRAVEVVRAAAAATDADLVVLASSHVGEHGGSLLRDSVSRRVAAVVDRPVLVVPVSEDRRLEPVATVS